MPLSTPRSSESGVRVQGSPAGSPWDDVHSMNRHSNHHPASSNSTQYSTAQDRSMSQDSRGHTPILSHATGGRHSVPHLTHKYAQVDLNDLSVHPYAQSSTSRFGMGMSTSSGLSTASIGLGGGRSAQSHPYAQSSSNSHYGLGHHGNGSQFWDADADGGWDSPDWEIKREAQLEQERRELVLEKKREEENRERRERALEKEREKEREREREREMEREREREMERAMERQATAVDDQVWNEGDYTIVSNDGVRFKIPSYYLFSSSAVFRESAGEVGVESGARLPSLSKRHTTLTDPIESAAVLRLFLEFIVYAKLDIPDDGTTLQSLATVKDLVAFLVKWECAGTLQLFLVCLREVVRQPSNVSPLAAFIAGAQAGDAFTCSVALDISDWTWGMMDRLNLPAAPDANVFDPHHMPVSVWQLLPGLYTWALTSAWSGNPSNKDNNERQTHRSRDTYADSEDDSASRCDSVLDRKVHAWQQWL